MSKEELKLALHKAFDLGSRYWQQADSEYSSQWKKADATRAQLDQLIEDTAKQALAAPVQPVAIHQVYLDGGWVDRDVSEIWGYEFYKTRVVYTTPPAAQRQWVGLTDEETDTEATQHEQSHGFIQGVQWANAKLKKENT